MNIEAIARIAHEVNRAYCKVLGDESQAEWEKAPQWQRESVIAGVQAHIANPSMTPQQSHEEWLKHKEKEGWVYGPVKNPEKKEHPCFCPYDELPREQRAKDGIFSAVIAEVRRLL